MKINVEIDCTPEEARRFFGLPDLQPMQQAVMERLQEQMLDAVSALSPEALLRQWAPMMPQTPEQLRAAMQAMMSPFTAATAATGGGNRRPEGDSGGGSRRPEGDSGGGRAPKE